MKAGQLVEVLHGSKGYARGVVVKAAEHSEVDAQIRVLVDQVAGANHVFDNVEPFEKNYLQQYAR